MSVVVRVLVPFDPFAKDPDAQRRPTAPQHTRTLASILAVQIHMSGWTLPILFKDPSLPKIGHLKIGGF